MKRRRLVGVLLVITILITACGSANYEKSAKEDSAQSEANMQSYDMNGNADYERDEAVTEEALTSTNDSSTTSVKNTNQKLIKDVYLDVETKEFDNLIETLSERVAQLKGYIESSEVRGNSYQYENMRNASLTIRIPCDSLDKFVSVVETDANVTNKRENTQDVTLQYVDMSSHVAALRAEQESLMKILEAATKVEDIIKIQSQLTDVRYEIESYESQLRTYDNLVSYSTVTLYIDEVNRETTTDTQTFGEEITARLSTNLYNIGQGFQNFVIWFISSLPYIVIWVVVIIVLVLILRKVKPKIKTRRNHSKDLNKQSSQETISMKKKDK